MFPLRSSSSGGSAPVSGGDTTPQEVHRRLAAVGGVSSGSYGGPQQQPLPPHFEQQQNRQQAARVESVPPAAVSRSSSSLSYAASFQLLGMEGKRAAIAAYPSASEVLLRHTNSRNSPSFRPRPQSPPTAPRERFPGGDAAPATPVAFPHPTAAAASTATIFRDRGPYVPLPLRNTTGAVPPRVYPQGAYAVPLQGYQQQQHPQQWQQTGQQGPVAGQPQRLMYGAFSPLYPIPPVLYQQQQRQHPMYQYPFHPTLGVHTQQLPKQYPGPQFVSLKQLQQQRSLPDLSGKAEGTDATPPRRLKSALRSHSSSQHRGSLHGNILKSGSSVRFALDENEVFRREGGEAYGKADEGSGVMPPAVVVGQEAAGAAAPEAGPVVAAQGSPGATAGTTAAAAALDEAARALPAAGAAASAAGQPRTGATKTGETAAPVASEAKAPTGAKGEEPPAVQIAAAKTPPAETQVAAATLASRKEEVQVEAATVADEGIEPAETPAAVETAAGAAGKQQGEGGGRVPGGFDTEEGQAKFALLYRPLAAAGTESPNAAASTSRAGGSGIEAGQIGGHEAFQKAEGRPQVRADYNHQPPEKSKPPQDLAAAVGAGGRGGLEQQQAAQVRQQQLDQQGVEQQQTLQQPKEKLRQVAAADSRPKEQQTETPPLPCLCVGHADHPHVCINFSASFQPKLLVRRSCAPALHIYAERQLPVKDYFVVPSTLRAAKGKAAAAAALAPAAGAVTANSKKMPEVRAPSLTGEEGRRQLSAEQHTNAQENQEAKDTEELREGVNKTEEETSASSDTSATPVFGVPVDDTARIEKVSAAAGAAAPSRDASAGEIPHESETERGVERTAEDREAHGLSRRDWMMSNLSFSFSPSALRSFSGLLRSGSLSLNSPEKAGQQGSRRGSSMSTDDGFALEEQEWRWKMAHPTIVLHRPFQKSVEQPQTQISSEAADDGAAAAAAAADAVKKNQRVLVVVDTTTEWWPSVQVRWLDAKKEELQQQERQKRQVQQQNQQRTTQQREPGNGDDTQEVEDEALMQKGLPTNCSGICMWSNHRPTLLDLRV